ncbi:MAG: redoxin domain-containing protein [Deltaproteobacteria bacterium]|nr:redoxin domain-containing protein [Deltaproteobacteria bacterium]
MRASVFLVAFLAIFIIVANKESVHAGENGRSAPEITGQTWINTEPLHLADLKGKVVMVEFWTFGCYNCRNVQPYVKEWHRKYADQGLVVIGVHTPETDFERYVKNVEHYVREQQISYAVVTDNDFATWNRYGNRAWPTVYLIDKEGLIRYSRLGEGSYAQTEQQIQTLLAEP